MKWLAVNNAGRVQPASGKYGDWKLEIADACGHQCVYCALHESRYGGLDNYHIDHFRPIITFDHLKHVITNLYLACAICNRFKGDDWPVEPQADHGHFGYPDPGTCDYSDLFTIDPTTFLVAGRFIASAYITGRLYLNRPQLIRERRVFHLLQTLSDIHSYLSDAVTKLANIDDADAKALLVEIIGALNAVSQAILTQRQAIPYELHEVRRPAKKRPPKKRAAKSATKRAKKQPKRSKKGNRSARRP